MTLNFFIFLIILIIFYFIFPTYYFFIPSIPIYPGSREESKIVAINLNQITSVEKEFFYLTNPSVSYAFLPLVNEDINQLNKIILEPSTFIKILKYSINRARPEQVNFNIKPIDTSTAKTPAFPAGHAFQAYYLAKKLSKKYPEKKEEFKKIANDCDLIRVKAGLHYPSDGVFSKYLVNLFY